MSDELCQIDDFRKLLSPRASAAGKVPCAFCVWLSFYNNKN